MEEKEEDIKINFFKKIWYSITKFEKYPSMAAEGLKRAIKYLIAITSIVTVFVMIGSLLQMRTLISDLAQYIQNNLPEFSYQDGKLDMKSEEPIVINDVKYAGIDRIIINTLVETDEQKEQIEIENSNVSATIFFFNDEIILRTKLDEDQILRQKYTYNEFISNYIKHDVEKFEKAELVEYITSEKMEIFYVQYGISMFIYLAIINILVALMDSLQISLLGWITTVIARIKVKFVAIYNMAIYSLTLPIILNVIYIIINYFTDFKIQYFQVAYITIAYIYLAAAIFILKDDFIKKMQEVLKIKQEQQKVREEIKEEEKEEPDKQEEDNKKDEKDNNQDDEPQGTEA